MQDAFLHLHVYPVTAVSFVNLKKEIKSSVGKMTEC